MRSLFHSNSIKSPFQNDSFFLCSKLFNSDIALTLSFSNMINTLPPGKVASIAALNEYKELIISSTYLGTYKDTILGLIDRLIEIISTGGITIHVFDPVVLATSVRLTVTSVYQDYLDGLNDGTDIDPVMLNILNEIKSASIS